MDTDARPKRRMIAPLYLRSDYAWPSPVNVTMLAHGDHP